MNEQQIEQLLDEAISGKSEQLDEIQTIGKKDFVKISKDFSKAVAKVKDLRSKLKMYAKELNDFDQTLKNYISSEEDEKLKKELIKLRNAYSNDVYSSTSSISI